MKYSLRAARKLENKIAKFVRDYDGQTQINISIYDDAPKDRYTNAKNKLVTEIGAIDMALSIRYDIRREIQVANEKVGINALTAKRANLQDKITFIETRLVPSDRYMMEHTDHDVDVLWNKYERMRKEGPSTDRLQRTQDSVNLPLLTEDMVDQFKKNIIDYKRQVEEIDEELLTLNASTKIDIEDAGTAFLKSMSII